MMLWPGKGSAKILQDLEILSWIKEVPYSILSRYTDNTDWMADR